MNWSMDRACQADFLPELLPIAGRREWESECSFGLLSVGMFVTLLVLALLPLRFPGFVGWDWLSPRQRAGLRLTLAPAILIAGLGSYHHDGGWMLIGFAACILIPTVWYLRYRPAEAPAESEDRDDA